MSREGCDGLFHTFRGPIRDGDSCVCGKTTYPPTPTRPSGDGTKDPAYETLEDRAHRLLWENLRLREALAAIAREGRPPRPGQDVGSVGKCAAIARAALTSPEART